MTPEPAPTLVRPALVGFAALTLLLGGAYPLLVWAAGRACFPERAGGSLRVQDGRIAGSDLLGRAIRDPALFWGRPSATVDAQGRPHPCDPMGSGGSNLAAGNPVWIQSVAARAAALRAANPDAVGPLPVDLVTASGSGLDPHISPEAAAWQVPRVARARGLPGSQVQALVDAATEGPQWGFLGEARVHLGRLNAALPPPGPSPPGARPAGLFR